MFGLFAFFFLASSTLVSGGAQHPHSAPPYVESRQQFVVAKTYLSDKLPPTVSSIRDEAFSFGVLAGTTAIIAFANYNHSKSTNLEEVDDIVPTTWKQYEMVAKGAQSLMNQATVKVSVVTNLIDTLCGTESIEECNKKIDDKVKQTPIVYQKSADLLLALGTVSALINDNKTEIDTLSKTHTAIPYLIHNAEKPEFKRLIGMLVNVYRRMKELQFRRLFDLHIL